MHRFWTALSLASLTFSLTTGSSAAHAATRAPSAPAARPARSARLAALPPRNTSYAVAPGDTLTSIAARLWNNQADWPALWWVNRGSVPDPDRLRTGQLLFVPAYHARPSHRLIRTALAATAPRPRPVSYASAGNFGSVSPASYSGFQECVISRESGGNSQIMNASGHYGLYQFSLATWIAYGGNAADFGHASVAEQNQVFANAMAAGGASNWSPYDGCPDAVSAVKMKTGRRRHRLMGWVLRVRAMHWAIEQRGKPYEWGGTGPYGYDCSGLVYAAYRAEGTEIPRDTYEMLASAGYRILRVYRPVWGDLAFFGDGHVELYVNHNWTFGAATSGTLVGYHRIWWGSWAPTMFFKVVPA